MTTILFVFSKQVRFDISEPSNESTGLGYKANKKFKEAPLPGGHLRAGRSSSYQESGVENGSADILEANDTTKGDQVSTS